MLYGGFQHCEGAVAGDEVGEGGEEPADRCGAELGGWDAVGGRAGAGDDSNVVGAFGRDRTARTTTMSFWPACAPGGVFF
ncbi:unnamed protein product [Linum trigynum]|uniref:Uncharacterized protein n=1 Tax=Linum trigynum TaxID=586398 RepID=A0AAV2G5D8_9ROSI